MLKNLWLVALRNMKKDKGYTLLNVIGLAIGITCCLFLIFYIQDELASTAIMRTPIVSYESIPISMSRKIT
jgi:hypothetical protein